MALPARPSQESRLCALAAACAAGSTTAPLPRRTPPAEARARRVDRREPHDLTAAYAALRETGHLTSRRGAGSWTTLPTPTGGHLRPVGLDDDVDNDRPGGRRLGRPDRAVTAARAAADDLRATCPRAGYTRSACPSCARRRRGLHGPGRAHLAEQIPHHGRHPAGPRLAAEAVVPAGRRCWSSRPPIQRARRAGARRARISTHGLDSATGWTASCCSKRCARPGRG